MSQPQKQNPSPGKPAASGNIGAADGGKQVDLHAMREPYGTKEKHGILDEATLPAKEPLGLFRHWFEEAKASGRVLEPNAVAVATASKDGRPAVRMMLLKEFGPEGFKFFTNYSSHKGADLDENPRACMLFYWDALNQQVKVEGPVKRLSDEENKAYFAERPKQSQASAAASHQSKPVESREKLEQKQQDLEAKQTVECPAEWGGYAVQPEAVEFWKGHTNRLHDRISFRRPKQGEKIDEKLTHQGTNGWVYERLMP